MLSNILTLTQLTFGNPTESNQDMLVKAKWKRGVLFTVAGLLMGTGMFSAKDIGQRRVLFTSGAVVLTAVTVKKRS